MNEAKSINPFTEDVVWTHPLLSSDEVEQKTELSYEAQKIWSSLEETDRLDHLFQLRDVLESKQEEMAKVISIEMGKTLSSALAEVKKCAFTVGYIAEKFTDWNKTQEISSMPEGRHRVSFQALGVTLGIMPWNFPIWQAIRFLAPSLALGNSVLLKPASNVFQSSKLLEEALSEAGFPEGVYQHLSLSSRDMDQVVSSPLVAGVSLTGSASAGKNVAKVAGQHMKKMVFELGGSDPYIVMKDADLDLAATKCTESRLLNSGQSCICAKRFIIDEKVKKEFLDLFVSKMKSKVMGDPMSDLTDYGPLARQDLREELHKQVQKAQKAGGKLLLGGGVPGGRGYFYPATIIEGVDPRSNIYQDEFFGPVALVNFYQDLDQAFELANSTPYGLGGGIFSREAEQASRLAEKHMHSGMVVINDYLKSDVRLPFGGVRDSGFGRELSPYGIHEFANIKTVSVF